MVSGTKHKAWLEIEHLMSFRETQLTATHRHTYTVEISETSKNQKNKTSTMNVSCTMNHYFTEKEDDVTLLYFN